MKVKVLSVLFLTVVSMTGPGQAHAVEKPKLVALHLTSTGVYLKAKQIKSLDRFLLSKLTQGGSFEVLSRPAFKKGKDGTLTAELKGSPPDRILVSGVYRVGAHCLVTADLYHASSHVAVRSATARGACKATDIEAGLEKVAASLSQASDNSKEAPVLAFFLLQSRGSPLKANEMVSLSRYLASRLVERKAVLLYPNDYIDKRLAALAPTSKRYAATLSIGGNIGRIGKICLTSLPLYQLDQGGRAKAMGNARSACDPEAVLDGAIKASDKLKF